MTITTLYVNKDANTRILAPDTNYGATTNVQMQDLINSSDSMKGYMEFDVTPIPDAQYVSNAVLRVRGGGGGGSDLTYLKSLNAQFTENTITWNNAPATNTDWSTTKLMGSAVWYEINVTPSWVQSCLSSDWLGIEFTVLGYDVVALYAKEYSSGLYKAELVITYSTSPPAATQINIGDVWKNYANIKINIGDTWKTVTSIKQNIGDTWKTVF